MIQSLSLQEAAKKLAPVMAAGNHKTVFELISKQLGVPVPDVPQPATQNLLEEKSIIFSSTFEYLLKNDRLPGETCRLFLSSAGKLVHFVVIRAEDFPEGLSSRLSETEQSMLIAMLTAPTQEEELVRTGSSISGASSRQKPIQQEKTAPSPGDQPAKQRPVFIRHDLRKKRRR